MIALFVESQAMKSVHIPIMTLTIILLSACNILEGYGQEGGAKKNIKYITDVRGIPVSGCMGEHLYAETVWYHKHYGLPMDIRGNFICEGNKPALPMSCEGKRLGMAELRAYWDKYQLPAGLVYFDCSTGIPKVRPQGLEWWQQQERLEPTCKDSRGRKRACI
ncbi:putative small secreted protein [Neisseria sp. HSC-16F19]|nr:hypothetical protein [Neisseria sp. HSC-16F19]MCP2041397.1 putative small secreted protein [Neisseria sp. HSC-16F19]